MPYELQLELQSLRIKLALINILKMTELFRYVIYQLFYKSMKD